MPWIAPKVGVIDNRGRCYCLKHEDSAKGATVDVVREPTGGSRPAYMPALETDTVCDFPGCRDRLIDADVPPVVHVV